MLQRKTFYFLRHGETDWNVAQRFQGQTDIPLNDQGRVQAAKVGAVIASLGIERFCTSHLSRAYETALIVTQQMDVTLEVIDQIKEVTIGECDGQAKGDPWYAQWKAGELEISGAETRVDFRGRVLEGINLILDSPKTALVVSHGGVYGALTESLNITPQVSIDNCMLLRLDPDPNHASKWLVTVLSQ